MAVVARARDHRAAAQVIDAAVADVRPPGLAALHQADGAGRARPQVHRQLDADRDDRGMGAAEGQVQESERVEQRLRQVVEHVQHDPAAGLRGARAVGVAAHAVHGDEQHRTIAGRDCGAILVVLAIAHQADVRELELHASP